MHVTLTCMYAEEEEDDDDDETRCMARPELFYDRLA